MKRSLLAIAFVGLALLAGLLFTVRSSSATAQVDTQAVAAANQLVNAGHTAEAGQMYEQLVAQSPKDAALLYNLGNTYFVQGDAGRALLAYQQAAALAPRDADIRANLALTEQTLGVSASAAGPAAGLAAAARRWLTVDEMALLALGVWFAAGLFVLTVRSRRV